MWRHPFSKLPNTWQARLALFVVLCGAFIATANLMKPSSTALNSQHAEHNPTPFKILALECAKTPSDANDIITYWRNHELLTDAKTNLRMDFYFLLAYSTLLAYTCFLASAVLHDKHWQDIGLKLMVGQWIAGIFDGVENLALLHTINAEIPTTPFPQIAFVMASLKFGLIILGICYSITGATLWVSSKLHPFSNSLKNIQ